MSWLILFQLVLVCSATITLDTFTGKKIKIGKKTCTCNFKFVENNDTAEVESASCNSKCSGKKNEVVLGGPASVANLYTIDIQVTKGKVRIMKISANLIEASTAKITSATSTKTTWEGGITTTQTTEKPKHVYSTGDNWDRGGNWNTCNRCVLECMDGESYPNIGQAFRGYNLILGDPLSYGGDPGYEGHIFDEATERNGGVRFANTAGNSLNRCDGSVRADYIETAEEYLKSTYRTKYSERRFQLGSEITITGHLEGNINAHAGADAGVQACANVGGNVGVSGRSLSRCLGACIPLPMQVQQQQNMQINQQQNIIGGGGGGGIGPNAGVGAGGDVCANTGVNAGVNGGVSGGLGFTVTLPPLYQSVSSNSKSMIDIAEGLESNKVSITKASFSCHEYEFEIKKYQHPVFTGQFKYAAKELESCFKHAPLYNDISSNTSMNATTAKQNECVKKFFKSYGTHYIKDAKFGSKIDITTVLDSQRAYNADKEEVRKCAQKDKNWSLLGIIGGGSTQADCLDNLYLTANMSAKGLREEIINTIGSRPKADYSEWAEQQGLPEIIHKSVAPISELFTVDFMDDLSLEFKENGDAMIKDLLHTYILHYCALFPSQCDYVVAQPFCPAAHCNSSTFDKCGHYTGNVDIKFLPHGKGVITFEDEVSDMIWHHGCTADCVVQDYGSPPNGYHLASEEEVVSHKKWIIDSLDKWAVAKFQQGFIYGLGYGGHLITTEIEEEAYKHMVVCKDEIIVTTQAPTTLPAEKTFHYIEKYLPWLEAAHYCIELGQQLASLSTGTDLLAVQSKVKDKRKDAWLAGNDMDQEGFWKWAGGDVSGDWNTFINGAGPMNMESNWESGEIPIDEEKDCLLMNKDGEFEDEECSDKKYFVCENSPTAISNNIPPKNYTYVKIVKKWLEAAQYCEDMGQKLATVTTGLELLSAQHATKEGYYECWLAGNDKKQDGQWNWAKGSVSGDLDSFINGGGSMEFEFNWEDGIPEHEDKDCLLMLRYGEFKDENCEKKKYFLCDDGTN